MRCRSLYFFLRVNHPGLVLARKSRLQIEVSRSNLDRRALLSILLGTNFCPSVGYFWRRGFNNQNRRTLCIL